MKGKERSMKISVSLAVGAVAGLINGLLGTGGGILLILAQSLALKEQDTKDRFVTAVVSILPMSVISACMYVGANGLSLGQAAPYLAAALPGGILGGWLTCRISPTLLKVIFALLMLWAGWRMAF